MSKTKGNKFEIHWYYYLVLAIIIAAIPLAVYFNLPPKTLGSNHLNPDYRELTQKQKIVLTALVISDGKKVKKQTASKWKFTKKNVEDSNYLIYNENTLVGWQMDNVAFEMKGNDLFVDKYSLKRDKFVRVQHTTFEKLIQRYASDPRYKYAKKLIVSEKQYNKVVCKDSQSAFSKLSQNQQDALLLTYAWLADTGHNGSSATKLGGADFAAAHVMVYRGDKRYIYFTDTSAGASDWAEHTYRYVVGEDGRYTMQFAQVPDGLNPIDVTMENVQWQTIVTMNGGNLYREFYAESKQMLPKMDFSAVKHKTPM